MSIFLLPSTGAAGKGYQKAFEKIIDKSDTKYAKQLKTFIEGLQPVFDHIGESDLMTLKFVKAK